MKAIEILVIVILSIFGISKEKLLMVSREKYNATCSSTTSGCENVLEQSLVKFNDWIPSCVNEACKSEYIEIILAKPFDITHLSIHQKFTDSNSLILSVFIQFNSSLKKLYSLYGYLTNILLQPYVSKQIQKIKINPDQWMSTTKGIGFNYVIAHAYDNDCNFFQI